MAGIDASRDVRMATLVGRRAELQKLSGAENEWKLYRTLCQFRLGYFSFLVLMCILMFSVTFLMEFFFAIYLPSARMDPFFTIRAIVLLAVLPFVLIFLSYCFEESSRLFLDAINTKEGCLANFRLSLSVCIHFLRHRQNMPNDRLENERFNKFRCTDEDQEAWARFVGWITTGPKYLLSTIHTDDPFDDENKEFEDEKRHDLELQFQSQQSQESGYNHNDRLLRYRSSSSTNSSEENLPSARWKRLFQVASTTVKFNATQFDGPPLDFSTLVITDLICPFVFEVITIWTFVVSSMANMSLLEAFTDYIQCGFYIQAIYLIVWMVCHFCSARNRKMREFVSNYRRRYRDMQRELLEIENQKRAEHLWLVTIGFRGVEQIQTIFFSFVAALFNFRSLMRKDHSNLALASGTGNETQVLHCGDTVYYTKASKDAAVFTDETGDSVIDANETQVALEGKQRIHKIGGRLNKLNLWSKFSYDRRLRILCPAVILSAIVSFYAFYVGWSIMGFCLILLGDTIQAKFPQIFGLTFKLFITFFVVLSFVFFSSTWAVGTFVQGGDFFVYPPTSKSLVAPATQLVTMLKKPMHWTKVAQYPKFKSSHSLNVSTARSSVIGSTFHPFEEPLPPLTLWKIFTTGSVEFVVKMLSMNFIRAIMPPPVYSELLDHVTLVRKRVGSDRLVLTGHSLGGAMAAMVGAKTHTPAISFSGPGLLLSRGRFDVDDNSIRDFVMTVKPRRDIVPQVDELGGMVQEIECRRNNPFACHSTVTHMCELYAACGDKRKRDWSGATQCNEYFYGN
ncbi:hypothetical protein PPTG_02661 [Plasmopara halstedii]|uniref:Fungal lipase-type domain-containing protein n=1 Tax=Plasmopara halstedii TaxID=4781 RepID=A0A0P1A587_PLAHL|nr:hypothetical protein PPTG_02661 [Plasmopara halstedii]CEG35241.1 hypothetical protein PPTG_02661 [Plasmopara halstedii]|eukprot:XP_024571610.1 hypothetical protein PPTG_02661 [Plasmopara halstedii]